MTAAAQLLALLKLGAAELVRAVLARLLPRALLGTSTARAARKASFVARAGARYGYAASPLGHIDGWRATELPGLETLVYLDYAGSALAHASQLAAAAADAAASIRANPHSSGPASAADAVERAKLRVLRHFCGARAHEWDLVWTSGATAALRLVAESFAWAPNSSALVYPRSAHTSVVGMREPALGRRSSACHASLVSRRATEPAGSRWYRCRNSATL